MDPLCITALCALLANAPENAPVWENQPAVLRGFEEAAVGHIARMSVADPMEILAAMIAAYGPDLAGEGAPEHATHLFRDYETGAVIADIAFSGLQDDSVLGEHWRLRLNRTPDGGLWYVEDAGRRVNCARGENAGEWGVGPCS